MMTDKKLDMTATREWRNTKIMHRVKDETGISIATLVRDRILYSAESSDYRNRHPSPTAVY